MHILSLYQIVLVRFCHKFKPYCDVHVLICEKFILAFVKSSYWIVCICIYLAFIKGLPDCEVHVLTWLNLSKLRTCMYLYQIVMFMYLLGSCQLYQIVMFMYLLGSCQKFKPYCDVHVFIWPLSNIYTRLYAKVYLTVTCMYLLALTCQEFAPDCMHVLIWAAAQAILIFH